MSCVKWLTYKRVRSSLELIESEISYCGMEFLQLKVRVLITDRKVDKISFFL